MLAPKAGTEGLDAPKLVLVAGVAPNKGLLSLNVVPLAAPNARLGGFCVPKVLDGDEMPKASVTGVANMGTDGALLSVEPKIPLVLPKLGDACTFVAVPTLAVPNPGVVLFVVSNAGAVVPACVVGPNNGAVVLPNIPLAVPKDVEGFVWPKIWVPLPNTGGATVVEVELALALENKLELGVLSDDTTLVVGTKIEGAAVVVGVLNKVAVSDVAPDPDGAPKSG